MGTAGVRDVVPVLVVGGGWRQGAAPLDELYIGFIPVAILPSANLSSVVCARSCACGRVRAYTHCYGGSPQVLHQLKAIDLWGRSVLTHALLSGHEMMFEAAYGAVRDDVNDEQVRVICAGRGVNGSLCCRSPLLLAAMALVVLVVVVVVVRGGGVLMSSLISGTSYGAHTQRIQPATAPRDAQPCCSNQRSTRISLKAFHPLATSDSWGWPVEYGRRLEMKNER